MRSILVTRPQPVADEFAQRLRREGFFVYVAPMMEYVEVDAALDGLQRYQALVFTSAQAVQIFSERSSERQLPVFTVGDATARAATKAGFSHVHSAKGDGDDVVALIREKAASLALKKILHLCSDDTPADIGRALSPEGIKVIQLQLYKARFIKEFPEDVARALRQKEIDTVTLFSARTAANVVKLMRQKELHGLSATLEAICISARVADELKELPWRGIRVANQPHVEAMLEALKNQEQQNASFTNRRERVDRRQEKPPRDEQGNIRAPSYTGPDRRTGLDRRAYEIKRQERIMQERMKILNTSALTFAFIFIVIVLAGVLLMGPEYSSLKEKLRRVYPAEMTEGKAGPPRSFSSFLNSSIERIQNNSPSFSAGAAQIAATARDALAAGSLVQALTQTLGQVDVLRGTEGGKDAVDGALRTLRGALAGSSGDPEAMNNALQAARRQDKTLDSLMGRFGVKDIAAAALFLTLSEFRSNVGNHRPYAEDLALLQRFAGNDPEMNRAIQRLSPYAESGIRGREALAAEFNGFAKDIVMATVQGSDISVKERALQRFQRLSKAIRVEDITERGPEAAVARARLLVQQGDVRGAMHEIQTLDGASAQAAEPWMDNAAGYVVADQSSEVLVRGVLEDMADGSGFSVENVFSAIKGSMQGHDVLYLSPSLKRGSGYSGVLAP